MVLHDEHEPPEVVQPWVAEHRPLAALEVHLHQVGAGEQREPVDGAHDGGGLLGIRRDVAAGPPALDEPGLAVGGCDGRDDHLGAPVLAGLLTQHRDVLRAG